MMTAIARTRTAVTQLLPLPLKPRYYSGIESSIIEFMRAALYIPLMQSLKEEPTELMNARGDALLQAVRDGVVWYEDGHFAGKFNAAITKDLRALGAIYNPLSKTWSLVRDALPGDVRMAQAHADLRYDALRRSFLNTLDTVRVDSVNDFVNFGGQYEGAINWMEDDFQKTLRAISIPFDPVHMTKATNAVLARDKGQQLEFYVKKWVEEDILKMRQQVQANTFTGRRAADLVTLLKQNYGVGIRKAEFLARQETSLLLSKYREDRYRSLGINSYRWSTSHDERVRHDHRDLNGKIFTWDAPPVTNRKTGARNNPGEDFNCRCVAIAIIE